MKKIIGLVVLGSIFAIGAWASKPITAKCAYCFSGQCISSANCGSGCVCMKQGLDNLGYCYSSDVGKGFTVLP